MTQLLIHASWQGLGPTESKGVSSPASQTTGVIAVPEVTTEVVNPTCEFVVMASDGLWDVLSSQQVRIRPLSASKRLYAF